MSFSINDAISEGGDVLRKVGIAEARRETGSLLAQVLGRDRTFIITNANELLSAEQTEVFRSFIARRARGEPWQYITGHQEFFKLDFEVTPDVLIPRPETEMVVEGALDLLKDEFMPFIADIGTGSGCIAISLLHELPSARAVATDISRPALRVAQRNADRHGVSDRLTLMESDSFSALDRSSRFSVIVSNPPYIAEDDWKSLPREVRDYEPRAALVSGPDGLANIRRLLDETPSFLRSDSHLVFEIGFGQSARVDKMIEHDAWDLLEMRSDLQGIPRTVVLRKK